MHENESRRTILIVDDVQFNIKILANALKDEYRIKIATDGNKAIELASDREDAPDLILLDVIMPGMDGYEVCRFLKNQTTTKNIPIIFVTARDEVADEEYGLNLGAVDYVTKPFHKAIIRARVRNHVELKVKTDLLETFATIDGLTGIPNRRSFDTALQKEWDRAAREGSPLSVLLMDIDHFKGYNDNYGHGKGDECLKSVASALSKTAARPADILARYGGEEFVAILPNTDHPGSVKIAEVFRKTVESLLIPHEFSATTDHVTISVGVHTLIPTPDHDVEYILKQADDALYRSKNEGRNRVTAGATET